MNKYRPLKVGLITNIPTPYRLPLFQLLSEQESFHLEVAFNAASERNRHWELPKQFDFNYTTLPGKTISFWGDDLISYHVNWGVADWIERKKFDALIVGGYAGLAQQRAIAICHRRKIPAILWSGSTAGEPSLARSLTLPLVRKLVSFCRAFIAYGSASKRYLEGLGAPPDRIAIATNTVDVEFWRNASSGAEHSKHSLMPSLEGRKTFLYVGQLIKRKGVDVLLRAFSLLQQRFPDTALLLAGTGPMEAALRNEAYQLGLKEIHFVGQIPYQQLPTYYAAVDAVVLPSRSEVWGLTINEAMAAGRPVIATNTTGVAHDLIKDGQTGWVAIADNVPSLAQCLIACATLSVAQRKDMGRRAQEYVFIHGALQGSIRGFLKAIQMAMGVSKDTNRQEL